MITMRQTCGGAPLQYEGTVNGVPFYFRARWGGWQFGVGAEPVKVVMGDAPGFVRFGAPEPDQWDAEGIIMRCCEEFAVEQARAGR